MVASYVDWIHQQQLGFKGRISHNARASGCISTSPQSTHDPPLERLYTNQFVGKCQIGGHIGFARIDNHARNLVAPSSNHQYFNFVTSFKVLD